MKRMRLSDVKTWPLAKGKAELLKHLKGEDLTLKQMILAKCYDCCCGFTDGKVDCQGKDCPLYPVMAYREGGARKVRTRTLTDEERRAISDRFKRVKSSAGAL